jgi:predicted dehydrogenase
MAATETGSNLFVEKPLANSLEGVDRLIDTVHTQKLVALVGCNMRFHPGVQRLHDVIQQGSLGSVVAVRAFAGQYLPDWHPSEDYRNGYSARSSLGGGVILDTIHEIDYVSWMLGGVSEVACFSGQLSHLEIDTEDVAAIILRGSSGQLGEVHLDYVQRNYSRGCEVIGDRGTARWDFMANSLIILREQGDVSDNAAPPGWVLNDMYLDEFRHLLACLDGVEEPMLDLPAGRDVLRIALAAKESSSQRCVVSLGER